MSSLIQAVLEDVTVPGTSMSEEECMACFDLDIDSIGAVEGGWERVDIGDPAKPYHEDLADEDYLLSGPAVYERNGLMIVRGQRYDTPVWFVYERANTGLH